MHVYCRKILMLPLNPITSCTFENEMWILPQIHNFTIKESEGYVT